MNERVPENLNFPEVNPLTNNRDSDIVFRRKGFLFLIIRFDKTAPSFTADTGGLKDFLIHK